MQYRDKKNPGFVSEGGEESIRRTIALYSDKSRLECLIGEEWIVAEVVFPPEAQSALEKIHDAINRVARTEGIHEFDATEYSSFLNPGAIEIGFHESKTHGRIFRIGGRKFKGYVKNGRFIVSNFDDGPETTIRVKMS